MSKSTCSTPECDRNVYYKGVCHKHYVPVGPRRRKPCAVEGCETLARCKGLCDKHYTRTRRHGDVETTLRVSKTETDMDKRLRWYGWTERTIRPELGPCWEWNGPRSTANYARISIGGDVKAQASRVAYEAWVGPIPDGMYMCHRCDNPPCIRPDHLFPGTHTDNMQDAARKNRTCHGEKQGAHKLTAEQVIEICELYESTPLYQHEIAKMYGISQSHVSILVNGRAWHRVLESQDVTQLAA